MRQVRRNIVLSLMLGFCLVLLCTPQASSQEWGKSFNPYTGQWEDVNPPSADPPNRKSGAAPAEAAQEVLKRAADPAEASAEAPQQEPTSKEAALQILQHKTADAAKWVYEQPACPSMHYHKPLAGKDVCANPLGDDVEVSCPAGASLVTDYHPAGSDACRSERSF